MYSLNEMFRKVFRSHGEFCATQPWEVKGGLENKQMLIKFLLGNRGHPHLPRVHPHRVGEAQ